MTPSSTSSSSADVIRPTPGIDISQSMIEHTVAPFDELPAHVEARHGPSGLARHRPVILGALETRHRPGEPEVVGERDVSHVAALGLPRVVVPGNGLLCAHLRRCLRVSGVFDVCSDTVPPRNWSRWPLLQPGPAPSQTPRPPRATPAHPTPRPSPIEAARTSAARVEHPGHSRPTISALRRPIANGYHSIMSTVRPSRSPA